MRCSTRRGLRSRMHECRNAGMQECGGHRSAFLHSLPSCLRAFSMSVLLITGGAGFIGSNFVRHALAHTDDTLVIVDKLTYAGSLLNLDGALEDPRVSFVRADIADAPAMAALFDERRPDAVVNLAAETHVDRSIDRPAPFIDTNIVGTFVLLEAARATARRARARRARAVPLPARVDRRGVRRARAGRRVRRGHARTPRIRRMRRARRRPIISCAPTCTPTGCRRSSRTARTTTGRISFPRS